MVINGHLKPSSPNHNVSIKIGRLSAAGGIATSCAREDAMVSKRCTIEVNDRRLGMVGNGGQTTH